MPGPVPKRKEERRRRNKDEVETIQVNLDDAIAGLVEIPAPPVDTEGESLWHPIAEQWYMSLTKSGQAIFYEPSDWSTAYLLAESLSRDLSPQVVGITEEGEVIRAIIPLKGGSLTAYLKGMSSPMTTEGERRRLKIEFERQKARDAAAGGESNVVSIVANRTELFS